TSAAPKAATAMVRNSRLVLAAIFRRHLPIREWIGVLAWRMWIRDDPCWPWLYAVPTQFAPNPLAWAAHDDVHAAAVEELRCHRCLPAANYHGRLWPET